MNPAETHVSGQTIQFVAKVDKPKQPEVEEEQEKMRVQDMPGFGNKHEMDFMLDDASHCKLIVSMQPLHGDFLGRDCQTACDMQGNGMCWCLEPDEIKGRKRNIATFVSSDLPGGKHHLALTCPGHIQHVSHYDVDFDGKSSAKVPEITLSGSVAVLDSETQEEIGRRPALMGGKHQVHVLLHHTLAIGPHDKPPPPPRPPQNLKPMHGRGKGKHHGKHHGFPRIPGFKGHKLHKKPFFANVRNKWRHRMDKAYNAVHPSHHKESSSAITSR
jgi:hypothetical protein